jgi:hypothetical protein
VLGWFELPAEKRPERRIWCDDEALNAHFARVFPDTGADDTEGMTDNEDPLVRSIVEG